MNEFGGLELFTFVIVLLVFLLLREFWCWYWKINKIVSLQRETNELLKALVKSHRGDKQGQAADLDKYEF